MRALGTLGLLFAMLVWSLGVVTAFAKIVKKEELGRIKKGKALTLREGCSEEKATRAAIG
jgi:hypothetical protein